MINIGKPLEPSGLLNLAWMAVNSKSAKKQFAFPLKFYTEHQFGFSFTYFEISAETMKAYYRVSMHSRLTEPPAVNSMPKTCLMTLAENIHRWGQDPCTYSRSPVLQAWTELAHYILIKTYFLFCKILSCLTGDQPYIDPSTYYSEYSLTQTGLQIQTVISWLYLWKCMKICSIQSLCVCKCLQNCVWKSLWQAMQVCCLQT